MKKSMLLFLCILLLGMFDLNAQVKSITGTVKSAEDGTPIPGVTVVVKGTTVGTTTNNAGNYTLVVPENAATMVFSFVGMKTLEVPISGQVVNATLITDIIGFDEVVIVGYGTEKKVGTTVGSLTQVTAEKIADKPTANILDALQGKVAGLQVYTSSGEPSQLSSIRLHGVGSLNGATTPLYVLDGVPIDASSVLALNPDDFESITVLKDASATSIYGTRAANGVIYMTTKRGKVDTKAQIRVNTQYGYSKLANEDFFNSFMNTKEITDFWVATGYQTQAQVDARLIQYPFDTKWYKAYYKNSAPTYQTNLSFSGGSGRTTYFISGSYFYQDGLAWRSKYDRYSIRSNINTKANDWLSLGMNILISTDKRQTNPYGSNSTNRGLALLALPYYSPVDTLGVEYPDMIPGWARYNPKYLANKLPSETGNTQLDGTTYIQLNPLKGLTIRTQAGIDAYDQRVTTKSLPSYKGSLWNGNTGETFNRNVTLTVTNTAEYKFDIKNRHAISLLAGQEGITSQYSSFYGYAGGLTDDRLTLLTAGTSATRNVTSSMSEYAYFSIFSRIDYSLDNKYFLDLSLRRDGSSRFGKNNRYANFWATGLMWNVKKESFMQNVNFLSTLNLKASIGTSGNSDGLSNYASLATIGTTLYNGTGGWLISSSGNPSLGWESQLLTTIGAKFALFNDKYRFNIEYYNRVTKNQIVDVPYPYTSGFNTVTTNVGSVKNTGIDVTFDFDIVRAKDYYVTPYLNFNYNKNEVTELFNGLNFWSIPNTGVCWIVGKPIEFFYPYFAGIDPADGKPMWYVPGTDPTKTSKETTTKTFASPGLNQDLGKPRYAPVAGGFGLNAGWKGFAIQADFAFAYKKYLFNNDRYFFENPTSAGFAGYNQSRRVLDYWKQPGDITEFPAYSNFLWTQFDSRLIEDASFMRLKNLTVSYTLPEKWLQATKFFSGVKIYATGRNLLTWTKYLGPDPEVDSNLTLGVNPNTKQFSFGADITF
jgi:TonB-linked SusC/RagA family outer membrane protein